MDRQPRLRVFALCLPLLAACGSSTEDLAGASTPSKDAAAHDALVEDGADLDAAADHAEEPPVASDAEAEAEAEPPDAAGVTIAEACQKLAQSICGRLEVCAPVLVDLAYADVPTCEAVLFDACAESLALPDTVKTPQWTADCAAAIAAQSCEAALTRLTPAACIPPPGPRPDGAPCGEDGQCASGYCVWPPGEACGRCRPKAPAGGSCRIDDDCLAGLKCNQGEKCAPYGGEGAECDQEHPCAPWLSCMGAILSPEKCVPVAKEGELCDAEGSDHPQCDLVRGYFCNGITHRCQALGLATAGQPCGVTGGGYSICTGASFCHASGVSGTCDPASGVGGGCDAENGPWCDPALRCVAGTCAVRDLAACQ